MDFDAFLDRFLKGRQPIGCTIEEIRCLETRHQVKLPVDYVAFLLKSGRGAKGLWVGSDYEFVAVTQTRTYSLDEIQDWCRESLAEQGAELPAGWFMFQSHQGCQYQILAPDGVYTFVEGKSPRKIYPSFRRFFEATATT